MSYGSGGVPDPIFKNYRRKYVDKKRAAEYKEQVGQLRLKLPSPPKRGRPRTTPKGESRHVKRERFAKLTAVHVTLKVTREVRNLRGERMYKAVRRAMLTVMGRADIRIVEVSLERDHVHLIVEAQSDVALAKGMQAFQIAAAQYLNQAISRETKQRRRGQVFLDRYFPRLLRNPTQAYRAMKYVLNNWRKHGEHRNPSCANWEVDFYSTAPSFRGWSRPLDPRCVFDEPWDYEPLPRAEPQHFFLAKGWRLVGELTPAAMPGRRP